ncbi:MAG TPA: pseudouridine-5'-phosphate glycosidase [Pyrinomonadaceae bacterium]|jgi:pseudouridine-5'-phosphate glycosidase
MIDSTLLTISDTVQTALSNNQPVVALESTVIAHGLPRPQNLEIAHRLQKIVRDAGAVPATIALLEGKLNVGLNDEQLSELAANNDIRKISIRDLPLAVARGWDGATTVASTIWIAHRAGIKVFATGGIGGVHRGPLPDVSADLPELTRTPIIVICSGAKIVLDLPATREWLETHGITVVGYQCDKMPAFYSRQSGLPVDVRVDGPADVVKVFRAQRDLDLPTSLVVTVPVPAENEVLAKVLDQVLDEALKAAEETGVSGRDLTPFLLSRMSNSSDGATLRANIALLENNARVAAEIAQALMK